MQATDFATARFNMIEQQIRPCEVIDENVLRIMRTVPREQFVPNEYQQLAFADTHIPLSAHSLMMKPVQEGIMLQALAIKPQDQILEVGTGSGFITACLARLGNSVISYEIDPELSRQAVQRLQALNIQNVELITGDIFDAEFGQRHFDAIALTGSVPGDIERLEALLAPGGRLFAIKGEGPAMSATLTDRDLNGDLYRNTLCETALPSLLNAPREEQFVF